MSGTCFIHYHGADSDTIGLFKLGRTTREYSFDAKDAHAPTAATKAAFTSADKVYKTQSKVSDRNIVVYTHVQ